MKKNSLRNIVILLVVIVIASFQSCKKDDELTRTENTKTEAKAFNPYGINDMNAYLSDFIKTMKSPTKDNASLPLEDAEWHLTACLNYKMCNANADRSNMIYDTIITKIHVDNNSISMTDINNSFVEISKNVGELYNSYDMEGKQIVYIYSTINSDNTSKGDAEVRTIMATGNKNTHYYFNDWDYLSIDTLFPNTNEYLWYDAADSLEKYVTIIGTQYLSNDHYYTSINTRTFNYNNYNLNPSVDIYIYSFSNRLFNCGNCPYLGTRLTGFEMAFYLDSYLGLATRENLLQSGSFISAVVDARVEENRVPQGEIIFHDLIATYGIPVIIGDNNNPSN